LQKINTIRFFIFSRTAALKLTGINLLSVALKLENTKKPNGLFRDQIRSPSLLIVLRMAVMDFICLVLFVRNKRGIVRLRTITVEHLRLILRFGQPTRNWES
jgi:hypothetical protein